MLQLPPGIDFNSLLSNYFSLVVPFVGIMLLFAVFRVIKKVSRGLV